MKTLELIKDASLHGGTVPNERMQEVRDYLEDRSRRVILMGMQKLVVKLMEYGMDYQYENHGSQGEQVESFELDCRIASQQGKLYFTHHGAVEEMAEDEKAYDYLVMQLDRLAIEETT